MNNGNERRSRKRQQSRKKYRLRLDRVAAAALVLVVMIVVLSSCVKSCSKGSKKSSGGSSSTTGSSSQPTIEDNIQSSGSDGTVTIDQTGTVGVPDISFTTEKLEYDSVFRGDLVLVNASHEYKFPEGDTVVIPIAGNSNSDHYIAKDLVTKLDTRALDKLNGLMDGFYTATNNNDIVIIGGYRTLQEQNDKYWNGDSGYKGGFSDYHTGRSFDMAVFPKDGSSSGYFSPVGIYTWIGEYAADFGFILRYPENKESQTGERARSQTYRYVGTPHSKYITQNDLCLEEYIDLLKAHTKDDPLEISVDTTLYRVYYAPANANAATDVPVPSNKSYVVSGNNVDGFIVTVAMN